MLNFFKKKNDPEAIYSPVNGQCILLENVPDQMFAQKLMGEGAGFTFEEDTVYAPCDGEIMMIAHTKHAIGIKSKNIPTTTSKPPFTTSLALNLSARLQLNSNA